MAESKQTPEEKVVGLEDETDGTRTIILKSQDGKEFTVERKNAYISKLISQALENGMLMSILLHICIDL